MHRREKVVAPRAQEGVVVGDSGGNDLSHAAFDDAFDGFGVLELLADGHFESGLDQAGHVGVERVVRKPREGHGCGRSVGSLGEHDVERLGGRDGVVAKGFIEVSDAKQQERLRVRRLEGVVLGHQRGFCGFLSHGSTYLCGGIAKITMRKRLTEEIRAERAASPTDLIPVVALLENLRSAHNVGSFFRSADAFGLAELWLSGYSCRPPHIQLDKVALGATETVAWKGFADAAEAIAAARAAGMAVYAVEQTDASVSLAAMPTPPAGIVLVFGNEVDGVEPATLALCDGALEVPQFGLKHSLNVSVCGGAVLWEACRRYRGL